MQRCCENPRRGHLAERVSKGFMGEMAPGPSLASAWVRVNTEEKGSS